MSLRPGLATLLVPLLLLAMNAAAQQFDPTFLRVPFQVDEGLVSSALLLEIPGRPIGQSLLGFGETDGTIEARAFTDLFVALRAGDLAKAASHHRPAPMSATDSVQVATLFSNGFDGAWDNIEVVRVYDLGREKDVVWEVTVEGTRFRRVTRIDTVAAEQGQQGFWLEEFEPLGLTALQNVIAEAEQLRLEGGEAATLAEADSREFHQEAPGTTARWHFDGVAASWDAFADADADMPDHPVARFFHESCLALRSGDPQAYGERFTPFSRQRFFDWVENMEAGEYQAFVDSMLEEGRQVQWIMEADPVFLVMFRTSDGRLPYQILYRDPQEERLYLTNFFAEGIFDNLLKDRDFFVRPVFETLFVATPEPPQPEPEEDDGFEEIPRADEVAPPATVEEETATEVPAEPSPDPQPTPSRWRAILLGLAVLGIVVLIVVLFSKSRR